MITAGNTEFPNNAIAVIAARIATYVDTDVKVFLRPLRTTDGTQALGIFPSTKLPDPTSQEIKGDYPNSVEPTLKRYNIILQALVTDTDEQAAISVHSIFNQRLWRMLLRDPVLATGLTSLFVDADNSRERFQRRGITLVRYLSNEIQGTFIQTSWLEFWLDTETVEAP